MLIERFFNSGLAQIAYGIADPRQRLAAIVDPGRDVAAYLDWAAVQRCRIVAILETHIHADFVSGALELAAATGAPIYASRIGESEYPHLPLDEGDEIAIGSLRLRALHTPGHTPEHVASLLYDDRESDSTEPVALFSGDVLFAGEVGRPDLLGQAQTDSLVSSLYDTVSGKLSALPDSLKVYPGHGAGSPCGKQIGDADRTTIGQEKRFNYAFQQQSRDEFARAVMDDMPGPPAYYPFLKQINKHGPPLLKDLSEGQALTADMVAALQEERALVVDARPPEAFARGYIPGSVNVGLDGGFAIWSGWLTPYGRPVILVLPGDERYNEALRELRSVGIDDVAGYLAGGVAAWTASGRATEHLDELPVADLAAALAGKGQAPHVLDVREPAEWKAGHIPGSHNVPAGRIASGHAPMLPADETVAVICGSGYRSSVAASQLMRQGFGNVVTARGGMDDWAAKRLPLERGGAD